MENIKELRIKKHLSQFRLAVLADVSAATIWRAEKGYPISEINQTKILEILLEDEQSAAVIDVCKK